MARHNYLRSTISPTIELDTITIKLRPDAQVPSIEMRGRVLTLNAEARAVSQATITTAYLTPLGGKFIEELKALFANTLAVPSQKDA